jgi:acyl transferase domain-containing protein
MAIKYHDHNGERASREPIAIIGSSCRFPGGATSPSQLWELLENPREVLQEIPASRFSTEAFYHADSQHHGVRICSTTKLVSNDLTLPERERETCVPPRRGSSCV